MTWQYRLVRHRKPQEPDFLENIRKRYPSYPDHIEWVDIREVYYRDDLVGPGSASDVTAWAEEAISPMASDFDTDTGKWQSDDEVVEDMLDTLHYFIKATQLPILNAWELPSPEGEDHETN